MFDTGPATGAARSFRTRSFTTCGTSLYEPSAVQDSSRELRRYLAADVLFDFDKASIGPDASATLHHVAAIVLAKPPRYCQDQRLYDPKGGEAYNMRLSQEPAAVKVCLVATKDSVP